MVYDCVWLFTKLRYEQNNSSSNYWHTELKCTEQETASAVELQCGVNSARVAKQKGEAVLAYLLLYGTENALESWFQLNQQLQYFAPHSQASN